MSNSKKNVVFVLPSLRRGGAETQLIELVNGLDTSLYNKHLFTFQQDLDQLDKLDLDNIEFSNEVRQGKIGINSARKLADLITKNKIDVVHCTLQVSLLIALLAIYISGKRPKLVLALHTTKNRNKKQEFYERYFYRWLMMLCDQIIFVCKNQMSFWSDKYSFLKGKSVVVYNGVDITRFNKIETEDFGKSLRVKEGIGAEDFVIANVAGFRPEKGHELMLNSFARLIKGKKAYLLLAGDGPLRQKYEDLAKKLGCYEYVRFLGNVSDVRPVISASTISVISSTAETFSMAMLESMAMGKVLAATNVGGTSEAVIHDKTGLIVPPDDVAGMTEAISKLISDESYRTTLEKAAATLVKENFTKEKMILKTSEVLLS